MHGGQWQVLYLLEGWAKTGAAPPMQYTLLAPGDSALYVEACERGFDAVPLSVRELWRRTRKADIVHAHDARAHTLAALVGGAPLVVSRRVGFPVRRSIASKWKYHRASLYLAVSQFVASELSAAGVDARKIRVVYDGVPIPPPAQPQPGRVLALAGKCESIVREAAQIAGVEVHWTSDLWQDLSTAAIFLYISELEGLGSAALAAMASGVPVIASRVGGLGEVVEHEKTGLLVSSPAQPPEIADAIRRLLDDPAAADAMGRNGRARVIERYSVETMRQETLRAYQEIAK